MALQAEKTRAGPDIPQTNGLIEGARRDPLLVHTPAESGHRFFVSGKLVKASPCFDIPDVDLRIGAIPASQQARAIGAERAIHLGCVNRKLERAISARDPIAGVERGFHPSDLVERLDIRFELGPTRKSIEQGDLELRISDRRGCAGLDQILGLVLEMPEVGAVGKSARRLFRIGRQGRPPFVKAPVVRTSG